MRLCSELIHRQPSSYVHPTHLLPKHNNKQCVFIDNKYIT